MGIIRDIRSDFDRKGHRALFTSLMLMLLINPFVLHRDRLGWLFTVFMTLVLLAAVRTVAQASRQHFIALGLAVPALLLQLFSFGLDALWLGVMRQVMAMLFLSWVCALLLRDIVLRSHRVNADLIFGAINVYLMAGLSFAMIFSILEIVQPGSFAGLGQAAPSYGKEAQFVYFSFITLTTLGYGDITPATPFATTAAYLEAIFGQMYIAVLVASLVGMFISNRGPGPEDQT